MKKAIVLSTLFWASSIFSLNLTVEATNKTTNRPLTVAEKITIIKLDETMRTVTAQTDMRLPSVFRDLEPMNGAPYMIQVTHQGVNYNKVLPPNTEGDNIKVNIDVYDSSTNFGKNLSFDFFVEIHYFKGVLGTDITYHFINKGNTTVSERGDNKGVLVYIPEEGQNLESLATLEGMHGASNIQTIKIEPTPIDNRPGFYLLGQPIKPGEKYYQTRAVYPYKGGPLEIQFDDMYPMEHQPQIILHAKGLKITWKENPSYEIKPAYDERMDSDFFLMPPNVKKFTLIFSGGEPEKAPTAAENSGKPVQVTPIYKTWLKFVLPAAFLAIILVIFYYLKNRPGWVQVMQAKNLSKLQFELENLKKLNLPANVKDKKEAALVKKINQLKKYLGT